ncbi:TetR family transcriptional regulator [Bradyrhizobium elkanii]|jgi:AcrR family transcriptional regulator|uniref:TetR/AcrR family transcriptional regulator n=2 Tax=Nitrobacteraceae TaxID=41294 RepID=UPI0003817A1E|nr:TetR family transcriptional regulator [Bradyrhizobium elkanii]UQD83613.1 TetR/AcrR family transcriptional regulator [Bradyrhizobium elkanii USDA 76]WLB12146.1 TetR family transcriptional regulator [Bradyrhizobium elkanii]GEC57153.1 TetR family transcriptional regulator [Bradyrhizobium elkanii]
MAPTNFTADEWSAKRARGRPRQYDRAQVLDRTIDVFLTSGLEGATMAELSRASGINRPSLRLAFGAKESLACAAVEQYRCRIHAALRQLSGASLEGAVQAMFRRFVSIYLSEGKAAGCLLVVLMPVVGGRNPTVGAAIAKVQLEIRDAVTLRMRAANSKATAAILTNVCIGMIYWLAVEARAGASCQALNETADAFARLLQQCSRSGEPAAGSLMETDLYR